MHLIWLKRYLSYILWTHPCIVQLLYNCTFCTSCNAGEKGIFDKNTFFNILKIKIAYKLYIIHIIKMNLKFILNKKRQMMKKSNKRPKIVFISGPGPKYLFFY